MAWILDGALILVLIGCCVAGWKRGFFRSVTRLLGSLIAVVLSLILASPVSQWVFDSWISPPLTRAIERQLVQAAVTTSEELQNRLAAALNGLPDLLRQALDAYGVSTPEQIGQMLSESGESTSVLASAIVRGVMRPMLLFLLSCLCFLLLFLVLSLIMRLLARALERAVDLPVVRNINRLLGGAIGLLRGGITALVLVTALQMLMTAVGETFPVSQETVSRTVLVSWVADHNPLLYPQLFTDAFH